MPVAANAGVDFRLNGVRCTMPAGSVWYLCACPTQTAWPTGDRVQMVIDAVVNDWVTALFERAARGLAA